MLCLFQLQHNQQIEMGAPQSCCAQMQIDTGETTPQENYREMINKKQDVQFRRGDHPSKTIAIELEVYKASKKTHEELQQLNTLIFSFAELQKKINRPLTLKVAKIKRNQLSSPYYIPSLGALYIGEWVFNVDQQKDVPGGIGRFFQHQTIYQGVFKTFFMDETYQHQIKYLHSSAISQQSLNDPIISQKQPFQTQFLQNQPSRQKISQKKIDGAQLLQQSHLLATDYRFNHSLSQLSKSKMNSKYLNQQNQSFKQQQDQGFIARFNKDFVVKLHGQGRIFSRKIEMTGEFDQGVLNGKGVLKNNELDYSYEGEWVNGQKNGKGKEEYKKFIYEGEFVNDKRLGKGKLKIISNPKQQHQIQQEEDKLKNKFNDLGQQMIRDAKSHIAIRTHREKVIEEAISQIIAQMKQRKQKNFSTIKLNEHHMLFDTDFIIEHKNKQNFSEEYNGIFYNNEFHGKGTYVWQNGRTYKGQWNHGKMHGYAEFYWPNGTVYEGQYRDDQRHGKGIMVWSSFKRYRGEWAYGYKHGYGESIQVALTGEKLTFRGDIWDRNNLKQNIFKHEVEIENFNLDADDLRKLAEEQEKLEEEEENKKKGFFRRKFL